MDCSPRDETHFVRCLKCLKILKCSRYDTSALLEHIRTDHPEIEIIESVSQSRNSGSPLLMATGPAAGAGGTGDGNCATLDVSSSLRLMGGTTNKKKTPSAKSDRAHADVVPELNTCDLRTPEVSDKDDRDDARIVYKRRLSNTETLSTPRKNCLYRNSIGKWKPDCGTLYCPKCGVQKRPLMKSRAEKMSQNSCGAACLLGCWPFCFLPFLCNGDDKQYLHCANCKTFLGLYDRNTNCIKPNREFLDMTETVKMCDKAEECP